MNQRRAAVQHVKLNLLKKSQFHNLKKIGRSSTLKDKPSLDITDTLDEEQKSFSS